jgi:membrane-bound lytic murein transglycosylase D
VNGVFSLAFSQAFLYNYHLYGKIMHLLIRSLIAWSVAGLSLTLPAEGWAWSSDRYHLEGALQQELFAESLDAPASTEQARSSDRYRLEGALQQRLDQGEATQSTTPATTLEASPAASDDELEIVDFDLPIERAPTVDRHVKFFAVHIRDQFEAWLSRLERYRPMVERIFAEFNLPEDLIFLSLVESGFNTHAVSPAQAVGPWQFIKSTAQAYGLRVDRWIDERRDPAKSTRAAASYLRDLYHLFGSWPLAMAAYNAGEGKVARALARSQGDDFWHLTDTALLKRETKDYVPRILAATVIAKDPGRFGFTIPPQAPVTYEKVVITRPLHLRTAAKAAGMPYEAIKSLNPELLKDLTPPDSTYTLKVPVGTKTTLLRNLAKVQNWKPIRAVRYQVRRGDTLARLASRHGTTVQAILEANDLGTTYRPAPGDWLLIPKPRLVASHASTKPSR